MELLEGGHIRQVGLTTGGLTTQGPLYMLQLILFYYFFFFCYFLPTLYNFFLSLNISMPFPPFFANSFPFFTRHSKKQRWLFAWFPIHDLPSLPRNPDWFFINKHSTCIIVYSLENVHLDGLFLPLMVQHGCKSLMLHSLWANYNKNKKC